MTSSVRDEPVEPAGSAAPAEEATVARGQGALADLVAVLGTYVVLGVVGALLWWLLCDPAMFTVTRDGGVSMGEAQLSKRFDPDAWYAVIAAGLGLVSGVVVTWWRSRDPLLTCALLVVGSAVAAAVMAVLGGWLGPTDPQTLAASAAPGTDLPAALSVDAVVTYLVWPVTTLIGALVVLWAPASDD